MNLGQTIAQLINQRHNPLSSEVTGDVVFSSVELFFSSS